MPVTVLVRAESVSRDAEASEALELTFDSPRIVIGRGDGCDLRLPDPSVSARHASIRQRGAEYVVLDEKSTNGTYLDNVALPPHSPRVLRTGELVRVGRVWLEVRLEMGRPPYANAAAARQLALALVSRGLAAANEEARPSITVETGPDAGKKLLLEPERRRVVGRAADADLALGAPGTAKKQFAVTYRNGDVWIQALGASEVCSIDGRLLTTTETVWKPGQAVAAGEDVFTLTHPALEALVELERSPDERVARDERFERPDPSAAADADSTDAASPVASAEPTTDPTVHRDEAAAISTSRAGSGWNVTDAAVMLLALGVLALSVVGLVYLLRV